MKRITHFFETYKINDKIKFKYKDKILSGIIKDTAQDVYFVTADDKEYIITKDMIIKK